MAAVASDPYVYDSSAQRIRLIVRVKVPSERTRQGSAARSRAKAVLLATLPKLSSRSILTLISVADRTRFGPQVSQLALNEAVRRITNTNGEHPLDDQLCRDLLARSSHSARQRATALAALGTIAFRSQSAPDDAVQYFAEALSLIPERSRWRLSLLKAAAAAGDRSSFYEHLTPEISLELGSARLARLLGRLAKECRLAGDWRAAADALDHARTLDPGNQTWLKKLDGTRKRAAEWGFYSADPERRWPLETTPRLASGMVAPILSHFVTGWVPASSHDTRIEFKVNGETVADARADLETTLPDGHAYRLFSRILKDVWDYTGTGDVLTIEHSGTPLPIIHGETQHQFTGDRSRFGELLKKIRANHVINKYGLLKPTILEDHDWQEETLDLYVRLQRELADGMDIAVFPFYGTMLGAVREQDFIRHDNDFDTIYISSHTDPDRVREEFKDVCKYLISRGFSIRALRSHAWVRFPGQPGKIDLFYSWFNSQDYFEVSYAYHGPQAKKSAEFFEFRDEKLGNFAVPVPLNAEQILTQLYGEGWSQPDSGFSHERATRTVDPRAQLTRDDQTEIYWNDFYRGHSSKRPSRFAEFVHEYFAAPGALLEFGCGDGVDGVFFARHGWTTFCCDRSAPAISKAQGASTAEFAQSASFATVDVRDGEAVQSFVTRSLRSAAGREPLVVYLRFFLHAIDKSVQDGLLDAITSRIDRDFYLCAEFRTLEDRHLAKAHNDHYRRYIDHDSLAGQLRRQWGFDIKYHYAGTGLSPHGAEDPHLCRIVAFRDYAAPQHG